VREKRRQGGYGIGHRKTLTSMLSQKYVGTGGARFRHFSESLSGAESSSRGRWACTLRRSSTCLGLRSKSHSSSACQAPQMSMRLSYGRALTLVHPPAFISKGCIVVTGNLRDSILAWLVQSSQRSRGEPSGANSNGPALQQAFNSFKKVQSFQNILNGLNGLNVLNSARQPAHPRSTSGVDFL
jgi:hypothetical protein